jgi:chromosome segregation ATPase
MTERSDTDNAYDHIARLRSELAAERARRVNVERVLADQDDKIAELRVRLDRERRAVRSANAVAEAADRIAEHAQAELDAVEQENVRLRASIEEESPNEAVLFALTARDHALRTIATLRSHVEDLELEVQGLQVALKRYQP